MSLVNRASLIEHLICAGTEFASSEGRASGRGTAAFASKEFHEIYYSNAILGVVIKRHATRCYRSTVSSTSTRPASFALRR